MSKITIDRSMLEQALGALNSTGTGYEPPDQLRKEMLACRALRAALEQPQVEQEPVAWAEEIIEYLHAHYDTEMIKELDSGDALIRLDDAIAAVEEVEQRYTHPQPPRQPLTLEQIHDCFQHRHRDKATERRMITRAIEFAHGITGEQA